MKILTKKDFYNILEQYSYASYKLYYMWSIGNPIKWSKEVDLNSNNNPNHTPYVNIFKRFMSAKQEELGLLGIKNLEDLELFYDSLPETEE